MDIEGYVMALSAETQSKETIRAYKQTLVRFEEFLSDRKLRVTQVKRSTVSEFITHLDQNKGRTRGEQLAPATIARQLAILSSFYRYLGDNSDGRIRNPVEHVKRPEVSNNIPRAVDNQILTTLLAGVTNLRDKAIILTFLWSGLRLSELAQLNRDSITSRKRETPGREPEWYGYGQVVGKRNKRREFRVSPKVLNALKDYIRTCRRSDNHQALFLSSRGHRISPRAIQELLEKWCARLDLAHINVHQLRHSFATRSVNAGMPLAVLQELLGHSDPDTTGRYFRVESDRKTREYFAVMEYIGDTSPV